MTRRNSDSPHHRLGEILLHRHAVTPAQLTHAIASQDASGGRLGDILVSLDLASPRT